MRDSEELINRDDPGWVFVKEWIDAAKNKVEILPCDSLTAREALYKTQVTTRSPMGAIVYMTGGLLVDNGWIRILGSGHTKLNRTLPAWNKGKTFELYGEQPAYLLVADDAVGGFFAINGGRLGSDPGKVYYLSPGTLQWEPLKMNYSEFLIFCFNGDLNQFYKGQRWTNWEKDIIQLQGDKTFFFYPYLWSKEGKDISKNTRSIVPVEETYLFNVKMQKELGLDKR
jgi:Protein of unknown function DUF2625